ncbi:MAG: hypothetical protein QOF46_3815, partial [Paraburkholderia sp.]|nr:hypothetical protein [Paraburkholderia sp.]
MSTITRAGGDDAPRVLSGSRTEWLPGARRGRSPAR